MEVIEHAELAQILEKAAAEIERLEAQNARLEQEIEKLATQERPAQSTEPMEGGGEGDWADILKQASENSDTRLGAPSQLTLPRENPKDRLEGWLASLA